MLTYIQVLIQQGQAQQMFFTKRRFHEEGLLKRASLSILFPKPEQRKHIPTQLS